jgi:hypothetical protein
MRVSMVLYPPAVVFGQDTSTGLRGFWLRVLPEAPKFVTMLCKRGREVRSAQ